MEQVEVSESTEQTEQVGGAKDIILASVKKNINVPGILNDVIDQVLDSAIRDAAAKSENKIDDAIVATLLPTIESYLKAAIKDFWEKTIS